MFPSRYLSPCCSPSDPFSASLLPIHWKDAASAESNRCLPGAYWAWCPRGWRQGDWEREEARGAQTLLLQTVTPELAGSSFENSFVMNFYKRWFSFLGGLSDILPTPVGSHLQSRIPTKNLRAQRLLNRLQSYFYWLALGIAEAQRGWAFHWNSHFFGVHFNASLKVD